MPKLAQATGFKKLLHERDRLTKETGYYYGLKDLTLRDSDPLKFERFTLRMLTACLAISDTGKYIAASPGIREMGELLFAIMAPEGDAVAINVGVMAHLSLLPLGIGWMLENDYEEDPGIRDGDVFGISDWTAGTWHPPDVGTYVPIFYKGEMVGWSAAVGHIVEIGATQAGSMVSFSPNSFSDGFTFPPMKTGENFKHHAWWYQMWRRKTRMGTLNILDEKCRLAGCVMLKDRVQDIIDEFGLDYYKRAIRERLEEGRRIAQGNIKVVTVPGRVRTDGYTAIMQKGKVAVLPEANRNWGLRLATEYVFTPEGKVILDVEGSSRCGAHASNCGPGGLYGSTVMQVVVEFLRELRVNSGPGYLITYNAPLGCLFNPDNPFASTANVHGVVGPLMMPWSQAFSYMYFARGYVEECFTHESSFSVVQGGGVTSNGIPWGFTDFGQVGTWSLGAMAYKDGMAFGGMYPVNPKSDTGDAEEWEHLSPGAFFIGRGLQINGCGHGKFRGGLGMNFSRVVLDPGRFMGLYAAAAGVSRMPFLTSAFGGYPSPGNCTVVVHNTNMKELIEKRLPYPRSSTECLQWLKDGRLKGEAIIYKQSGIEEKMEVGDIICSVGSSGGGWGDPIERDLNLAEDDVRYGWLTPDVVKNVYGVVVLPTADGKDWKVDEEATKKARQQIKETRKKLAIPARDWWLQERARVLKRDMVEEIRDMHQGCLTFDKYRKEFTSFWQLGEDFKL